jgi:hypothetical protein
MPCLRSNTVSLCAHKGVVLLDILWLVHCQRECRATPFALSDLPMQFILSAGLVFCHLLASAMQCIAFLRHLHCVRRSRCILFLAEDCPGLTDVARIAAPHVGVSLQLLLALATRAK